jgi:ABC-type multidrug transport system ATPase subunit
MVFVQAAIEARAIGQRAHSGNVTLRDISLTVSNRELVAIIGGSGSGKTTLLDALSGLRPPASGTVLRAPLAPDGIKGNIAYVPDGDTSHPVLPLARALGYAAALRGVTSGAAEGDEAEGDEAEVDEALRVVDLAMNTSAQVGDLNPGERKRAAIAAELLTHPALLFLEEPTAHMDPAQGAEVMRVLRRVSDSGATVVLTTSSPLDAARCDKVAVLATGGHLAFFGTPAAARGYFGADSLDEIYERLAGLGDPAVAWSRRFFHFSRSRSGFAVPSAVPHQPGPGSLLVPDVAGPHSAGPVSTLWDEGETEEDFLAAVPAAQVRAAQSRVRDGGTARIIRQLPVLMHRNTWILAHWRRAQFALVSAPLAALLVCCVLFGIGALDGPATVSLAWGLLGGLAVGLGYGLALSRGDAWVLRCERFAGLSVGAYIVARLAILLPAAAVADVVVLAVPGIAGRLPFGPSYVAVLVCSLLGLAIPVARTVRAALPHR